MWWPTGTTMRGLPHSTTSRVQVLNALPLLRHNPYLQTSLLPLQPSASALQHVRHVQIHTRTRTHHYSQLMCTSRSPLLSRLFLTCTADAGVTGHIMVLVLFLMVTSSVEFIRCVGPKGTGGRGRWAGPKGFGWVRGRWAGPEGTRGRGMWVGPEGTGGGAGGRDQRILRQGGGQVQEHMPILGYLSLP